MKTTSLALLLALQTISMSAAPSILVRTLSTRADLVTGGDVLIAIGEASGPTSAPLSLYYTVSLNGRDVGQGFFQAQISNHWSWVGLVTGLTPGRNVIAVAARKGGAQALLPVTNYPLSGPVFSGPHQKPFVCQTETFKLPDGSTLGPATDADCSAPTKVEYVYMPHGGKEFKPLPDTTKRPEDVELVTDTSGRSGSTPFIVRVETGTMNRGIYQNLVLHDPTTDPSPTPRLPPPAWNRRLIALHGVGCPSGWYRQGGVMGVNPLTGANIARLREGYAIFTNTLNHPTNSCNAFLAGETTMMGKEHVIEEFGVPEFTVSIGTSGGAYTSLQIADEFPGLFDGILINATFPDALAIALAGEDAHLLAHYFATAGSSFLTEAQKIGVSGYQGTKAFLDAANQSQRTDPVADRVDIEGYKPAVWNEAMPASLKYDAKTNPRGARPTVFDAAINIYGADPRTGFALRPFDNVGVQYGLAMLKPGVPSSISPSQFLELNERIGGYDQDGNYTASRSVGDAGAIMRAYQAGVTLGGGGGLGSIPVFDDGAYNDERGYHYQWFHFAIRERIARQNGNAGNHVMWRGPVQADAAWTVFVKWVAASKGAIQANGAFIGGPLTGETERAAVVRTRPAEAVDGCWIVDEEKKASFVAERQTFSRNPDTMCNEHYPSSAFTRYVAGGPIDANILKCQLKPIDPNDYPTFTPPELQRLHTIFPGGICDFSKPGVNQTRVVPWASVGPAPKHLIFDARLHKTSN